MASWLIAQQSPSQTGESRRYSWRVWTLVLSSVLIVHYIAFDVVHNLVDMRACTTHLPDPLYTFIPFDARWSVVSEWHYLIVAGAIVVTLFLQAFGGIQLPVLRLGIGICIQTFLRCITLLLIPVCRANIPLGTPGPVPHFAVTDAHFYALGFRGFAVNDLVFSGHTGFFLLFLYVTVSWPRAIRVAIAIFALIMIYGLLAAREHYTIDILLAVPCSYFADSMAMKLLHRIHPR